MSKKAFLLIIGSGAVLTLCFLIDYQVRDFFMRHASFERGQWPYDFWDAVSRAGQGEWYLGGSVTALAAILLWRRLKGKNERNKKWLNFCLFLNLTLISSGLLVNLLKVIFGRARPRQIYRAGEEGFYWFRFNSAYHSFPSGHTIMAMTAALAAAVVFPRLRYFFLLLAALIGVSRITTYAHYPSDVVAAIMIAAGVVFFWHRRLRKRNLELPQHPPDRPGPAAKPDPC